ncbi:MAG TPA: putative baseplate assembly protein [Actinomycetota bacterium]|nr:putative baseplate assembly protein [Actinomycetota bacterium]
MIAPHLSGCGCCEGLRPLSPLSVENPPGLPSLAYRVGTHGAFKETMKAALSRRAPLAGLTTRDDDDATIALMDAWAMVLDVLGFYQERMANEGFLRTATERRSVLELARSIGYELSPGVAAGTYLAFELETAAGAPEAVTIPSGTRVQSVPGPGETPQTFETVEDVEARGPLNELQARRTAPLSPAFGDTETYLQGVGLNLRPGDGVLLVGAERETLAGVEAWDFRVLVEAKEDPDADRTMIRWEDGLGWAHGPHRVEPAAEDVKVYAFRRRAAVFGHNAPDWRAMPTEVRTQMGAGATPTTNDGRWPARWTVRSPDASGDVVDLDAVHKEITVGSWVVLSAPARTTAPTAPAYVELYEVTEAADAARADFTLTGKVTRLTLDGENLQEKFGDRVRDTMVFAESERLTLAEVPLTGPVQGDEVVVMGELEGLAQGKPVIVRGTHEATGEEASEVAFLAAWEPEDGLTALRFDDDLNGVYRRNTVRVHANVAPATHGETKEEVLGSGDASRPFQRFSLAHSPLTYVSAATAAGARSSLEVRIDDVLWQGSRSLFGEGPADRAYVVRLADDGEVTVRFGDGATGSRLPTGTENVRARYRAGTGLQGMVKAGQLSLLMTRPLGVRGVTNPLPATGGADPESLGDARTNAPRTVRTFDRIVSLRDFEDFARSFPGIGKATARWLWDGERRIVHVTVGAAGGGPIPETSDPFRNLRRAIEDHRDYRQPFRLQSYQPLLFRMAARLFLDPAYLAEKVQADVTSALRGEFSFARRGLAQPVTASEVLAAVQAVAGVVGVDLDALHLAGQAPAAQHRLEALPARRAGQAFLPAQLLTLDPHPDAVQLSEAQP